MKNSILDLHKSAAKAMYSKAQELIIEKKTIEPEAHLILAVLIPNKTMVKTAFFGFETPFQEMQFNSDEEGMQTYYEAGKEMLQEVSFPVFAPLGAAFIQPVTFYPPNMREFRQDAVLFSYVGTMGFSTGTMITRDFDSEDFAISAKALDFDGNAQMAGRRIEMQNRYLDGMIEAYKEKFEAKTTA